MTDDDLLAEFVQSFEILDDNMLSFDPIPLELRDANDNSSWQMWKWKPALIHTDPAALDAVYKLVPGPFPPLYEQFVTSYRWLEVDLEEIIRLLPNVPANSLMPLLEEITGDPVFVDVLLPKGFIPFGKASGTCYDPFCFDTGRRGADGDCPIVRFEHEAILCNLQIGDSWEVAGSFRTLAEMTIARASEKRHQ